MTAAKRTAAVHQPNLLPWAGFFYKWLKSDVLVLLDDVQFIKRSVINRVKIKGPEGERLLTVPVISKGRYHQTIAEVEIQAAEPWQKKILGSIGACYGKAPYFERYFAPLETTINGDYSLLVDLNTRLLTWIGQELGIEVPTCRASDLEGVTGTASQRLVSICKAVGADRYLSGFGGQKYQQQEEFNRQQVRLEVYGFTHPTYGQLWGDFIPGLSILDLLFNCGPQSRDILEKIGDPYDR